MSIWLKNALVILTLVTLGALALSTLDNVSGHGGGFQLTRREVAGPYELVLGTIPRSPRGRRGGPDSVGCQP